MNLAKRPSGLTFPDGSRMSLQEPYKAKGANPLFHLNPNPEIVCKRDAKRPTFKECIRFLFFKVYMVLVPMWL